MITGHRISLMSSAVTLQSHGKGLMRKYNLNVMVVFYITLSQLYALVINFQKWCCSGGVVSHSFDLEAKTKGMFYGAQAVITFRIPTKAALQVGHS